MSRMPPALSAPAMPRKIVQSSPSIRSQMRRAVARLRPWKEIFSIRASISSARRAGIDGERLDRHAQEAGLLGIAQHYATACPESGRTSAV